MYRLEVQDGRHGRPWVLTATFAGQRLWVADFQTLGQAMAWVKARELKYGIDMGLQLRKVAR